MSKSITEYTARRVVFDTSIPAATVLARLDQEVNKGGGGPALFKVMATSTTRRELEEGLNAIANGRDFMYFADNAHHRWLDTYLGAKGTPVTYVYTIGNPLIAQTMLRHDLTAGLNVPVKILILEKADGSGTKVIYDDPASIIPVTLSGGTVNEELKKGAQGLSEKLERLVARITSS